MESSVSFILKCYKFLKKNVCNKLCYPLVASCWTVIFMFSSPKSWLFWCPYVLRLSYSMLILQLFVLPASVIPRINCLLGLPLSVLLPSIFLLKLLYSHYATPWVLSTSCLQVFQIFLLSSLFNLHLRYLHYIHILLHQISNTPICFMSILLRFRSQICSMLLLNKALSCSSIFFYLSCVV